MFSPILLSLGAIFACISGPFSSDFFSSIKARYVAIVPAVLAVMTPFPVRLGASDRLDLLTCDVVSIQDSGRGF